MANTTVTIQSDTIAEDPNTASSTVDASFNYWSSPTIPDAQDTPTVFTGTSPHIARHVLPVTDLRSLPVPLSTYSHEIHGFQFIQQSLPIDGSQSSVHDLTVLRSQYFPSITSLLKKTFNARSAVIVNHTLRDVAPPDLSGLDFKNLPKIDSFPPFFINHSDCTPGGSRAHLRCMTTEWFKESETEQSTTEEERAEFFRLRDEIMAAEDDAMANAGLEPGDGDVLTGKGGHWNWDGRGYSGPRYALFSIWRPWETVKRDPLAFMDTSDSDYEFVALPREYKNRAGYMKEYYHENALILPPVMGEEAKHKWCFLNEQRPDEITALKFYDSEALRRTDGSVKLMCPHSAFHTKEMDDAPVRRSCELRVWVIW